MKSIAIPIFVLAGALFNATADTKELIKIAEDCIRAKNSLIRQLADEGNKAIEEMKNGLFCSECNRSKSEIEKVGEAFGRHLGRVKGQAVSATNEQLKKKANEYNRKIAEERETLRDCVQTRDRARNNLRKDEARQAEERRRQLDAEDRRRSEAAQRRQRETQEAARVAALRRQQQVLDDLQRGQALIDQQTQVGLDTLDKLGDLIQQARKDDLFSSSSDFDDDSRDDSRFDNILQDDFDLDAYNTAPDFSSRIYEFSSTGDSENPSSESMASGATSSSGGPTFEIHPVFPNFSRHISFDRDSKQYELIQREREKLEINSRNDQSDAYALSSEASFDAPSSSYPSINSSSRDSHNPSTGRYRFDLGDYPVGQKVNSDVDWVGAKAKKAAQDSTRAAATAAVSDMIKTGLEDPVGSFNKVINTSFDPKEIFKREYEQRLTREWNDALDAQQRDRSPAKKIEVNFWRSYQNYYFEVLRRNIWAASDYFNDMLNTLRGEETLRAIREDPRYREQ